MAKDVFHQQVKNALTGLKRKSRSNKGIIETGERFHVER
jgi:hypothetical protein